MTKIKIYSEEDFKDLPEDERPYKVPFTSSKPTVMVWTGGRKYYTPVDQEYGSSCSPSDRDPKLLEAAIVDGRRAIGYCSICHKPHYSLQFVEAVKQRMIEHNRCFHCDFFERAACKSLATVIGGRSYTPGNATSGPHRGMGGRRFDIEYFAGPHAGKKITTYDLWAGGEFPLYWRPRVPDTARFISGGQAQVGDTVCWDSSDPRADVYPLPHEVGIK